MNTIQKNSNLPHTYATTNKVSNSKVENPKGNVNNVHNTPKSNKKEKQESLIKEWGKALGVESAVETLEEVGDVMAKSGKHAVKAVGRGLGPIANAVAAGLDFKEKWDEGKGIGRAAAETAVVAGAGFAGAWGGAKAGAAIGSLIAPGIGTAVGGVVGGILGATTASVASDKVIEKITK